jgi:transposase-like protein
VRVGTRLYTVQRGVHDMNKYREFSPDFKVQVVLELLTNKRTASEICRQHQLKDSLLYRWKQEFLERAPQAFAQGSAGQSLEQARIAELEGVIGRLTVELEAAKKVSGLLGSRRGTNAR